MTNLTEASFYVSDVEREELIADTSKVVTAFIYNFVGIFALAYVADDTGYTRIRRYFKGNSASSLDAVDSVKDNGMTVSVKLMADADLFRTPVTAKNILKFLRKIKSGSILDASEDPFDWLSEVRPGVLRKASNAQVKKAIMEFMSNKTSNDNNEDIRQFVEVLKKQMRKDDPTLVGDFFELARKVKISDSDMEVESVNESVNYYSNWIDGYTGEL